MCVFVKSKCIQVRVCVGVHISMYMRVCKWNGCVFAYLGGDYLYTCELMVQMCVCARMRMCGGGRIC